ncbi:unnamed protein product, partial [Linum tenue]
LRLLSLSPSLTLLDLHRYRTRSSCCFLRRYVASGTDLHVGDLSRYALRRKNLFQIGVGNRALTRVRSRMQSWPEKDCSGRRKRADGNNCVSLSPLSAFPFLSPLPPQFGGRVKTVKKPLVCPPPELFQTIQTRASSSDSPFPPCHLRPPSPYPSFPNKA